jgi:uncharacterized membrane-anchored protein YjiN (DUF445 family)
VVVAVAAPDYRRKANRVLGLVLCLFAAAAAGKYFYPHSLSAGMLFFVAEAALVGGIADWFAVTALFRRPLGFPWHTALIPRSREKIIAAIAPPSRTTAQQGVDQTPPAVSAWSTSLRGSKKTPPVSSPRPGRPLARTVWENVDIPAVARNGQKWLKTVLLDADLARYSRQGLAWALATGKADRIIERLLAELTAAAARDATRLAIERHLVRYSQSAAQSWWQKLALGLAEATDTLNLAEAAAVLHAELQHFLRDLAAADHPVRAWVRARLAAAAERLESDPAWTAGIDAWQKGLAGRLRLEETIAAVATLATRSVPPDWPEEWAARQAGKLWSTFKTDLAMQDWVEEQLQTTLHRFIDSEHDLVAAVVRDALARLSDDDLNRFIEDKAGEDLAWIRINGSVVGGIVGLLLFLFVHYFYDPYVVPLVHAFLGH